ERLLLADQGPHGHRADDGRHDRDDGDEQTRELEIRPQAGEGDPTRRNERGRAQRDRSDGPRVARLDAAPAERLLAGGGPLRATPRGQRSHGRGVRGGPPGRRGAGGALAVGQPRRADGTGRLRPGGLSQGRRRGGRRQGHHDAIAGFLDIPERSSKPRERGITHVIDRGLSVAEIDGLLEVAGPSVDIVKLGWGTALVTQNLREKLARYEAHGIPVVLGGTLTEVAIRQGRVDGLVAWLRELGIRHVEISDGTIELAAEVKRELIERLAREFTVFAEVGSKDVDFIMAPYVWVEQIERDLEAGAWKVIAEARESGTAGIYRATGEVRTGLIDEIVHAIDPERLIFEAPLREQQVWLLKRFGTECNLGNIAPADVVSLETLRLGLRSDTVERFALGDSGSAGGD